MIFLDLTVEELVNIATILQIMDFWLFFQAGFYSSFNFYLAANPVANRLLVMNPDF